jgi:hypothetical protein
MQQGRGHAAGTCTSSKDMSMRHGHGHAAYTGKRSMDMDMQHEHNHRQGAYTCSCCKSMSISMLHVRVHAIVHVQFHAANPCPCPFCRELNMQHWIEHAASSFTHKHGHGHAAFPFYSLRIIFVSLYSLQVIFVSLLFASYHTYSFRMANFRIHFETNRSESNPLICYFAKIYSFSDLLYSLRSEYERTP